MKWIPAVSVSLVLASCAPIAPPASKGSVDHVVLVWLKRPGNIKDREALLAAGSELRTIPGMRLMDAGTPLASERPVVDDSFDVGFIMRFDSADALGAYENHPLHQEKVKEILAPLSQRIVIHDIVH